MREQLHAQTLTIRDAKGSTIKSSSRTTECEAQANRVEKMIAQLTEIIKDQEKSLRMRDKELEMANIDKLHLKAKVVVLTRLLEHQNKKSTSNALERMFEEGPIALHILRARRAVLRRELRAMDEQIANLLQQLEVNDKFIAELDGIVTTFDTRHGERKTRRAKLRTNTDRLHLKAKVLMLTKRMAEFQALASYADKRSFDESPIGVQIMRARRLVLRRELRVMDDQIANLRRQLEVKDGIIAKNVRIIAEKDSLIAVKDSILFQKDNEIITERNGLISEIFAEQSKLVASKDSVTVEPTAEKDEAVAGKDNIIAQKDVIIGNNDCVIAENMSEVGCIVSKTGSTVTRMIAEQDDVVIADMHSNIVEKGRIATAKDRVAAEINANENSTIDKTAPLKVDDVMIWNEQATLNELKIGLEDTWSSVVEVTQDVPLIHLQCPSVELRGPVNSSVAYLRASVQQQEVGEKTNPNNVQLL